MIQTFTILGAGFGFLAVAIGAFGAHGLKNYFLENPDLKEIFHTGVNYHFSHALAIFVVASVSDTYPRTATVAAGWCFVAGIIIFSGSLYALALTGIRKLGMITPIGGLFLLAGWALIAWSAFKGTLNS